MELVIWDRNLPEVICPSPVHPLSSPVSLRDRRNLYCRRSKFRQRASEYVCHCNRPMGDKWRQMNLLRRCFTRPVFFCGIPITMFLGYPQLQSLKFWKLHHICTILHFCNSADGTILSVVVHGTQKKTSRLAHPSPSSTYYLP